MPIDEEIKARNDHFDQIRKTDDIELKRKIHEEDFESFNEPWNKIPDTTARSDMHYLKILRAKEEAAHKNPDGYFTDSNGVFSNFYTDLLERVFLYSPSEAQFGASRLHEKM